MATRWRAHDDLWVDHEALTESDLERLLPVRRLTMWAVKLPADLLARLPFLETLDLRGGSGSDVAYVAGCPSLRELTLNQIRGLSDLSAVETLAALERLELYGLPRVTRLPDLSAAPSLTDVALGSMKGIEGLGPVLAAPALSTLTFTRAMNVALEDADAIRNSGAAFSWHWEDVPASTALPFIERASHAGRG